LSKRFKYFTINKKYMKYTEIESIDERIEKKIEAAKERKYFIMRELDECNKLIPGLEEVVKDWKDALKPWYRTSWKDALDAVMDAALDVAWDVAWRAAFNAAWGAAGGAALNAAAGDVAWDAASYAAGDVAWDAAWEVIRDIKGYENNPFEKIVKIYNMGLYPRGFRKVNGIEKYIVDFPLITGELGCWTEGDKEIPYKHMWDEDCNKIRPVRPLRIIE
jgi:hypothetical protein